MTAVLGVQEEVAVLNDRPPILDAHPGGCYSGADEDNKAQAPLARPADCTQLLPARTQAEVHYHVVVVWDFASDLRRPGNLVVDQAYVESYFDAKVARMVLADLASALISALAHYRP